MAMGVGMGGEPILLAPRDVVLTYVLDGSEYAVAEQRRKAFEAWRQEQRARYLSMKRGLDIVLALTALIALAPLLLVIAALIKLDDGGPVLYRREMLGLHNRPFSMFKFRTMTVNAEQYLLAHPELRAEYEKNYKLRHDPRVTRIGRVLRKYSLDELPQLWNILRGDMSLVGPRCIPTPELALFGELAPLRHSIRPGLTGLWQVSGRSNTSYAQRIRLDREYVLSCSLRRDLTILLRTVHVVLRSDGAY